tara:strand:+ start:11297 stop:12151 length:855 start_codon:yes stop_codon:yes gene_type:complete
MSFKTEIEAIVGDIDSPDYTSEATLYLVEGVKFITKSLMIISDIANRMTSSTTLNNSPTTMSTASVLEIVSVTRNDGSRDRKATEIKAEDAGDYTDVNSIYFTSKLDPKYYIQSGTLNVIPTPANGQSALIKHITPDTSVALGDTSIDNLPDELERGVVLYASRELLRYIMNQIRKPNVASGTELTADMAAGAIGTDADKRDYDKYFDISMDFIADEDVELAQTMMQQIQTYLQNYQVDLTADTQQYQWYESQYVKVTQDLLTFLSQYIGIQPTGEVDEIAADD